MSKIPHSCEYINNLQTWLEYIKVNISNSSATEEEKINIIKTADLAINCSEKIRTINKQLRTENYLQR